MADREFTDTKNLTLDKKQKAADLLKDMDLVNKWVIILVNGKKAYPDTIITEKDKVKVIPYLGERRSENQEHLFIEKYRQQEITEEGTLKEKSKIHLTAHFYLGIIYIIINTIMFVAYIIADNTTIISILIFLTMGNTPGIILILSGIFRNDLDVWKYGILLIFLIVTIFTIYLLILTISWYL